MPVLLTLLPNQEFRLYSWNPVASGIRHFRTHNLERFQWVTCQVIGKPHVSPWLIFGSRL